jgi:pimeloyl-ACP methyl ester carboxylesterase
MKHHVIYVPGLSDDRTLNQDTAIQLWRLWGVTPHYHAVGWADKESFAPKLARLVARIDELKKDGSVSLVGVSAGASAVLHAYAKRPDTISSVAYICGKIQNPQTVSEKTKAQNPAFAESIASLAESLQKLDTDKRKHILSVRPKDDDVVPVPDTKIEGVEEKILPTKGHGFSIFYAVIFAGYPIVRFLKTRI